MALRMAVWRRGAESVASPLHVFRRDQEVGNRYTGLGAALNDQNLLDSRVRRGVLQKLDQRSNIFQCLLAAHLEPSSLEQ